jgi:hypothetical protein
MAYLVSYSFPYACVARTVRRRRKPHYRDNASMYDFINIFTEDAKTLRYGQKIDVETNAGALAAWISTHKRKFL